MDRQTTIVGIVAVALATMAVPLVAADHFEPAYGGSSILFDHRGGNEWWVEVAIVFNNGGNSSLRVDTVQARDEGDSTWHPLELKSWGEWAASFHIETGHKVQFRAAQRDGAGGELWNVTSGWFTHPQGVEQDGGGGATFAANFYGAKGNAWWIETHATANQPISSVKVSLNNGSYQPMALKSWGAYATSLAAPSGTIVRFQALNATGSASYSGCYLWTAATPVSCSYTPPPEPPAPNVTFDHRGGNEWWVETKVVSKIGTITQVQAKDANSPWTTLTLRSWGNWAGSFHIEAGQRVSFRAAIGGDWYVIEEPFTHSTGLTYPGGKSLSPGIKDGPVAPAPTSFTATFSEVQCKEWWQQVDVDANQNVAGVDMRLNGGTWTPLQLKSWGDWARSTHAFSGDILSFRARNATGVYAFSDGGFTCYGGAPYPPEGDFDARFANVEFPFDITRVIVYANEPLTDVQLNTTSNDPVPGDSSGWQYMTFDDFNGRWSVMQSTPVNGTVQFRARGADPNDWVESAVYPRAS